MLPARLVAGLRPVWRSTRISSRIPSPSHFRPRLGVNTSVANLAKPQREHSGSSCAPEISNQTRFDPAEPRFAMAFTCTADGCGHRSAHTFTKRAYERGIVLIQCPSCKNRHLIADNLGWFKDDTDSGRLKNVEDILRVRGEAVQRGILDANGVIEVSED